MRNQGCLCANAFRHEHARNRIGRLGGLQVKVAEAQKIRNVEIRRRLSHVDNASESERMRVSTKKRCKKERQRMLWKESVPRADRCGHYNA
jgi:hypothetical protein